MYVYLCEGTHIAEMSRARYIVPRHNLPRGKEGRKRQNEDDDGDAARQEDEKEGVAFAEQPSSERGREDEEMGGRGGQSHRSSSLVLFW